MRGPGCSEFGFVGSIGGPATSIVATPPLRTSAGLSKFSFQSRETPLNDAVVLK
jgi:hypothetical protein